MVSGVKIPVEKFRRKIFPQKFPPEMGFPAAFSAKTNNNFWQFSPENENRISGGCPIHISFIIIIFFIHSPIIHIPQPLYHSKLIPPMISNLLLQKKIQSIDRKM